MSNKVIFIADFFAEHVTGGGELNNEELIKILINRGYNVVKMQSHLATPKFIVDNENEFFIISNFINLHKVCKRQLVYLRYIIYEHDHKYLRSRNPATYDDFKAPERDILNYTFYKNAIAVLCQSSFHKDIVELNLKLDNIISLGGNLWSLEHLKLLRKLGKTKKSDKCSIMDSPIEHKNTYYAVRYCIAKGEEYERIPSCEYTEFLTRLSKNKTLVFFPKTPETLSRIVVEARMMGISLKTNNLVGATKEDWFKSKGEELIDLMIEKREQIANKVEELFENTDKPESKEISILSTFHEGEQYLEHFLKDITSQTMFDKCELILIDAASTGNEQETIKKYMKKYDNIVYRRLEKNAPPTECINMAIKISSGKYLTLGNIDDRRKNSCLAVLYWNIIPDNNIDLVYGDCWVTDNPNETFENNTANGQLLEHSLPPFSRENMIRCLPGPMPLWRKSLHEDYGLFDGDNCNFADDWEMWLRAVNFGSTFKKVDEVLGLYLAGGRSQQDSNLAQKQEEAALFFHYSHIFGHNFPKFKPYFDQFLGK